MAAAPFPTTAVCDTGKDAVQLLLGIRALDPAMCAQGPAYPIQLPPGDNLDFRTAMDTIPAGSVVVLEAGGALDRAVAGDLVVQRMMHRKLAGLVVWGCVRDAGEIVRLAFPTFVAGTAPFAPRKNGGGAANVPVTINGVRVRPGDAIVGDADGVIVVAKDAWDAIAAQVPEKLALDERRAAAIRAGVSLNEI